MKFLKIVSVLVLLSILASACAAPAPAPAPASSAAAAAPAKSEPAAAPAAQSSANSYGMNRQLYVIFVTHDLGAGVFAPVRRGMEDACKQINAKCEFIGPQTYDLQQQVALIEAAIAKKPDAIATTRVDPAAYNDTLKKAIDAGIKVVTFNTNDPAADKVLPLLHVGQDFTNYGKVWARLVMQDIPEGGDIAITDCCFGHYALEERNRSFKETLEKEGQGKWKVRDIINTTGEEEKVYAAIESYYNANKDIKGIYGVDYYSGIISQFIKRNNLQGKLKTGGSDLAPGNVEGLKEGYTSFGLGQNPYWQGYMPVMMMHQLIAFGVRPNSIDTGTDAVTPKNIAEFDPNFR